MKMLALACLLALVALPLAATPGLEVRHHPSTTVIPHNSALDMGDIRQRIVSLTLMLVNTGSTDLEISNWVVSTPFNCTPSVPALAPVTIAAQEGYFLNLSVFLPAPGTWSFALAFASNDPGTPNYWISVYGLGHSAPDIRVRQNGTEVAQGGAWVGTLVETGVTFTVDLTVDNFGIDGSPDLQWSTPTISMGATSNCNVTLPPEPTVPLAVLQSVVLSFEVTPTADVMFSFAVTFHTNDPDEPSWYGTFYGSATSGPVPRMFGNWTGGWLDHGLTYSLGSLNSGLNNYRAGKLHNIGYATLLTTGSPAVTFSNQVNCTVLLVLAPGASVAPADSTNWTINVIPTAPGPVSFDMTLTTNAVHPAPGYVVGLVGVAIDQPVIKLREHPSATPHLHLSWRDLGNLPVGQPFEIWYTITNEGGQDLVLSGTPTIQFNNLVNCNVTMTQDVTHTTLTPAFTTSFRADVTPLAAGVFTFEMLIINNDPGYPDYTALLYGGEPVPGGGGGGKSSDKSCSTGHGKSPWAPLLAAVACGVLAARSRRARAHP